MYWVMGILPFALLLLGFPIFLLLLITSLVILFGFFDIPMTVVAQDIFNSLNKYALLGRAVLRICRQCDVARRHFGAFAALGRIADRRFPRPHSVHLARLRGAVRRDLGRDHRRDRGDRHADLSAHAGGGLQRRLRRGPDHVRRRARQPDPAVDRDDHLWHRSRILRSFSCGPPASARACCWRVSSAVTSIIIPSKSASPTPADFR